MRCKKCKTEISVDAFWGYCDKCNKEFDDAIKNGALILYKGVARAVSPPVHYWMIRRYLPRKEDAPVFSKDYLNLNQVKAIVEARRIAEKHGIEKIVFEYSPHYSRWFLDDYLACHPTIEAAVNRALKSRTQKVLKVFSFLWSRS